MAVPGRHARGAKDLTDFINATCPVSGHPHADSPLNTLGIIVNEQDPVSRKVLIGKNVFVDSTVGFHEPNLMGQVAPVEKRLDCKPVTRDSPMCFVVVAQASNAMVWSERLEQLHGAFHGTSLPRNELGEESSGFDGQPEFSNEVRRKLVGAALTDLESTDGGRVEPGPPGRIAVKGPAGEIHERTNTIEFQQNAA